jgi:hypothetical protein
MVIIRYIKNYEPSSELCSVCPAALLMSITDQNEEVCPNCEGQLPLDSDYLPE